MREVQAVVDGGLEETELEAAKSYALGRYQMGAQTVSQISGFYTNRYFADGIVKEYEKVPEAIRAVTCKQMVDTAKLFLNANTWVLAAVTSEEKDEVVELSDRLAKLFPSSVE